MAAFAEISGQVAAVSRDNKSFKVEGDDRWFSAFNASQLQNIQGGETVVFKVKEVHKTKASGEAAIYYNVQGNVSVKGSAVPAPSGSVAPVTMTEVGKVALARDRTIARQNAMAHAVYLVNMWCKEQESHPIGIPNEDEMSYLDLTIAVARKVEAYTTGDLDMEIAKAYIERVKVDDTTGRDESAAEAVLQAVGTNYGG